MDQTSAILDLQIMLDQLSYRISALPRLVPTGVFDEQTLEAVMIFQRDIHPPVTGIVDIGTWNAIKDSYQKDLMSYGPPSHLRVLPFGTHYDGIGASSYPLLISETLFHALSDVLDNFSPVKTGGTNRDELNRNLRELQRVSGLPEEGALDRASWEHLIRLYHAFITRGYAVPQI